MAKTKSDNQSINALDLIVEKYGNIISSGVSFAAIKPVVLPVSPSIDIALGGGIPEGSFCIFTGPPKAGKTTLALWLAANAQAISNQTLCPDGRQVHFLAVEGRLKPRDLQGIPHLDLGRFHQIASEPGRILKAHEYLDAADMIIRNDPGCIIIIDSFSSLCTESEMTAGMDEMQRADGPKLLAKFCRKVANVLPVNKVTLIGITHLMANVTGYGAAYQEKSGQSIAYQVDVKLRAKSFKLTSPTEEGNPTGQEVEWRVECSAIGGPGAVAKSYIQYGRGINASKELANIAVDLGIIEKKGSWFSFTNQAISDKKMQGLDNISDLLDKDKTIFDKVKQQVYTSCGIDI